MKITPPPFPPVHVGGPPRNDPPAPTAGGDESFAAGAPQTAPAPTGGPGKSSASPAFLARQAVIDDPELANLPFGQVVSQIARGVFGQNQTTPVEGDGTTEGDGQGEGEGDGTTQSTGDAPPPDGTGDGDGTGGERADGTGDGDGTGGETADGTGDGDGTGGDGPEGGSVDGDGLIAELLEELGDETDEEVT